LSAPSRFRRKESFSPSATSKIFFQDLVAQGNLRQAKIRESSGLIKNITSH
jgi:hypothetical protein